MKRYIPIVFAAVLLLSGCQNSWQEWENLAKSGDAEAVRRVGMEAFYGGYHPVDYRKAAELFRLSAEKNADPVAQYYWGVILEKGLGMIAPDVNEAQKMYAAAQKTFSGENPAVDAAADLVRGEMAYYGRGRRRDLFDASVHYEQGAQRLLYDAMVRLGVLLCSKEEGVAHNPEQGRYFLEHAAEKGRPEGKYELSRLLRKSDPAQSRALRDAAAAMLVPGALRERAEEDKNGDWLQLLAGQGDPDALYRMAQREPDALKKIEFIRESAARGNPSALAALAGYYRKAGDQPRLTIVSICGARQNLPISLEGAGFCHLFPMRALWQNRRTDRLLQMDSSFDRYADGFRACIDGSYANFQKALKENPFPFYYGGDFFRVVSQELPLSWAGDIFRGYLKAGGKVDAGFLMNYAILAGLAGQYELQRTAALRLESMEPFRNCALLLQANSLIMNGKPVQAYEKLQKKLSLPSSSEGRGALRAFVAAWCPYLLVDRAKTAVILRCRVELLPSGVLPKRQQFYDFERDREMLFQTRFPEPEL